MLIRNGVPADRIVLESESRTTREQVVLVTPLLKARGWDRFVQITSPVHLTRAARGFAAQGLQPVPVSAPYRSEILAPPPPRWWPDGAALALSERSMYDYIALFYYWMRGWLTADLG